MCDLASRRLQKVRVLCLSLASTPDHPVFGGLRDMEAEWISPLAGGRALFLDLFSIFVMVCVLFRKARRRRLPKDGIEVSRLVPVSVMRPASSVGVWSCVSG